MELNVIKNEQNHLEFVLKGERHTLPGLLKAKLLNDEAVTFASYVLDHPFDNQARFVVKTKGSSAKKALTEACDAIEEELKEFEGAVKKAVK